MQREVAAVGLLLAITLGACAPATPPTETGANSGPTPQGVYQGYGTDQEAIAGFRQLADIPDVLLESVGTDNMVNSPHGDLAVSVFQDQDGRRFLVEPTNHILVEFDGRSSIAVGGDVNNPLSDTELSDRALQIARASVPKFDSLSETLQYSAGNKGGLRFFDWRSQGSPDWLMPPFLQVGMLESGEVFAFINTVTLK